MLVHAGPGGHEEEAWRPLLAPAFLQGLWLKLEEAWRRQGVVGAGGSSGGSSQTSGLRSYLQAGTFPDGAQAWQQVLLLLL